MATPIKSCSFFCDRYSPKTYAYTTFFHDENNDVLSRKTVEFSVPNHMVSAGRLVDVYSQNGICSRIPEDFLIDKSECKHLFGGLDEGSLKRAAQKLNQDLSFNRTVDRTVLVLDLKDSKHMYRDLEEIKTSEDVVCKFISTQETDAKWTKTARRIHKLFQKELPIHYVFCEGSLKAALAQKLSEDQKDYFFNPRSPGRKDYCEYTEPYITAIKLGHEICEIPETPQYMTRVSPEIFTPQSASITMYPKDYQDTYSPTGRIPTALRSVYPSLLMDVDSTLSITSMTLSEGKL